MFYQLHTIHDYVCGRLLPLVYCSIAGKSQRPKTITIDFKKSVENAVKQHLPMTTISFCFFHFKQNLWRQMQVSVVIAEFEKLQVDASDSINSTKYFFFH